MPTDWHWNGFSVGSDPLCGSRERRDRGGSKAWVRANKRWQTAFILSFGLCRQLLPIFVGWNGYPTPPVGAGPSQHDHKDSPALDLGRYSEARFFADATDVGSS